MCNFDLRTISCVQHAYYLRLLTCCIDKLTLGLYIMSMFILFETVHVFDIQFDL